MRMVSWEGWTGISGCKEWGYVREGLFVIGHVVMLVLDGLVYCYLGTSGSCWVGLE